MVVIWNDSHVHFSILIDLRSSVLEANCVSVDSKEIRIRDVLPHPCFAIRIGHVIMNHQVVLLGKCSACPVFGPAGIVRVCDKELQDNQAVVIVRVLVKVKVCDFDEPIRCLLDNGAFNFISDVCEIDEHYTLADSTVPEILECNWSKQSNCLHFFCFCSKIQSYFVEHISILWIVMMCCFHDYTAAIWARGDIIIGSSTYCSVLIVNPSTE